MLAAFVILALVATALFRLFSGSLTNASAAEEWSRALLIAESQLDAAASAQPLKETTDRGSDSTGVIQWETRVEPYVPPDPNPDLERQAEMLGTRLFRVTTDVKFPAAIKAASARCRCRRSSSRSGTCNDAPAEPTSAASR